MKIAILSMYSGVINRGVETWTRELSKRLTVNNDVLVFQGSDEQTEKIYNSKEIKLKIFWKLSPGESWWSEYLVAAYWISLNLSFTIRSLIHLVKYKPDVVIPTNGGVQTLLIRIFSKLFGWKMVVVGHAGIGMPEKWNILMRPDLYIMPSERGKKWAKDLWFSKGINIINIPHGIDLDKFNPKIEAADINLPRPIILCVSSFDPYKRVDLAVKAVSRLENASLLILGGDRSSGEIDALGKKLLGERYLRKKVQPNEVPGYYTASDLFTLPSDKYEAFGIVYLEALASNLAVVATDDELRKEIIGSAGILVDPREIDKYSDSLKAALEMDWEDTPRKQAEKFAWNKIVKRYEEELEKTISNNQ